jgi:hypothetical protein
VYELQDFLVCYWISVQVLKCPCLFMDVSTTSSKFPCVLLDLSTLPKLPCVLLDISTLPKCPCVSGCLYKFLDFLGFCTGYPFIMQNFSTSYRILVQVAEFLNKLQNFSTSGRILVQVTEFQYKLQNFSTSFWIFLRFARIYVIVENIQSNNLLCPHNPFMNTKQF